MGDAINYDFIGSRLKETRLQRDLTLEEVSAETGISVPTLSRIERLEAKGLQSETLLKLSKWLGTSVDLWRSAAASDSTPDVVELHLRADKHLDAKTAKALAQLFRTAYEQLKKKQ